MQIITKYKGGALANAETGNALLSPKDAFMVHQEFVNESPVTGHTFTLTGSPAISKSTTVVGGALVCASNATPAAYACASTTPVAQAAAGRTIACEMNIAVTDVATANCAQFAGLSSSGTVAPITAAGVPDGTRSCIGFAFVQGAINGVFGSAAAGTVALATGNTAGTLRRLGFVVKGTSSIDWYVDGNYVTTSTTVPTTVMFESFSNASAVQQGCTVDYFHLAYNR